MAHTRSTSVLALSLATSFVLACSGTSRTPLRTTQGPAPASYEAPSSAPASAESSGHVGGDVYRPEPSPDRPGLGTEFGEQRHSQIERTRFVRSSASPAAMLALHYNDSRGVQAQLDYHRAQMSTARSYAGGGDVAVTITDSSGRALQGGSAGGKVYVVGRDGDRYNIDIRNDTRFRLEVVASVDGLDVIDGTKASPNKRGYIVPAFSSITIEGFRTSDSAVAAFRFGAVRDSYAARTSGDRNVGVIGIAIFSERGSEWTPEELRRRDTADPFPGYAKPPTNLAN